MGSKHTRPSLYWETCSFPRLFKIETSLKGQLVPHLQYGKNVRDPRGNCFSIHAALFITAQAGKQSRVLQQGHGYTHAVDDHSSIETTTKVTLKNVMLT